MNRLYIVSDTNEIENENVISFKELNERKFPDNSYFKFANEYDRLETFDFDFINSLIKDSTSPLIRIFAEFDDASLKDIIPNYRLNYEHIDPYFMLFDHTTAMMMTDVMLNNDIYKYALLFSTFTEIPSIFKTTFICRKRIDWISQNINLGQREYLKIVEELISLSNEKNRSKIINLINIIFIEILIIDYKENANIKYAYKLLKKVNKKMKNPFVTKYHFLKTSIIFEISQRSWRAK